MLLYFKELAQMQWVRSFCVNPTLLLYLDIVDISFREHRPQTCLNLNCFSASQWSS